MNLYFIHHNNIYSFGEQKYLRVQNMLFIQTKIGV